jgi:translation initiation factor IF-3
LSYDYVINNEIKNHQIRISGEKDLMSLEAALALAAEHGVDLIQIAERDGTSICVLEELSKYIYQQKKRSKDSTKTKTKTGIKEMKLGLNIGDHDMLHKAKKTIEMMEEGYKVRVSLYLSGREITRSNEGIETVRKFVEKCAPCTYDKEPKLDGKIVSAVIFKK